MSSIKVGINGLGRIGRGIFRCGFESVDIVAVNARGSSEETAHLLQYDSVHGKWDKTVTNSQDQIFVDKKPVAYLQHQHPSDIPWHQYGVDIVLECTGAFKKREDIEGHFKKSVQHVFISSPFKDADFTLVYGVNQDQFQKQKHKIISNASCTTNALAPLIKVLQDNYGVEQAFVTTVHSYTKDQNLLDSSHTKDIRRARAAALNMIPTSTGAAKAIGSIFPHLKGKIKGQAIRVPVANVSLIDLSVQIQKQASVKDINEAFKTSSEKALKNILGFEEKALVSSDFIGRKESSIVDALSTDILQDKFVKVLSWYDNEVGFSQRMIDFIKVIN